MSVEFVSKNPSNEEAPALSTTAAEEKIEYFDANPPASDTPYAEKVLAVMRKATNNDNLSLVEGMILYDNFVHRLLTNESKKPIPKAHSNKREVLIHEEDNEENRAKADAKAEELLKELEEEKTKQLKQKNKKGKKK